MIIVVEVVVVVLAEDAEEAVDVVEEEEEDVGGGYNLYSLSRPYDSNNFKAEAKNYGREEYKALSKQQQMQVQQL